MKVTEKKDELILAVTRTALLHNNEWQGLQTEGISTFLTLIQTHKEFLWRSALEVDPTYKQIIPYLIFQYQDTYFLMQRKAKVSEQRLRNKYSLGIGGHVRQEDLREDSLFSWAQREFYEEVIYPGTFTIEPIGILNDDSNEVGKVHIGLVLLLKGSTPTIKIGNEHASGHLATVHEIASIFDQLETWSQIVFNHLHKGQCNEKNITVNELITPDAHGSQLG